MSLGMELGLGPGDFVLDWDAAPTPKRGGAPQFSLHVYCGQTAAWIKMPLGTVIGLGLRDIVFDVAQLPPEKGNTHPNLFLAHVYCGQTAGWMKTPLGTEVDLGPGHIVLDCFPAPAKGAALFFRPMSIVDTVANLSYC